MKRLLVILCCLALLLPTLAFSQMRVFHREYSYRASEDDGRNQAREKAIKETQKLLLEDVGIIVESRQQLISKSSGGDMSEYFTKEINTYTLGKISTTIIPGTEKWDGRTYSAKFAMEVDTAALYKYLGDVMKQKEQARADSLRKAREISDLQLAVEAARNSLEKEQGKENPLKIEKDKKERELKLVEKEKNNAQDALDRALNTRPVNMARIESERKIHEDAERNYSKALAEYNMAYSNWDAASKRVGVARKNLQVIEGNLAKAIGVDGGTLPLHTKAEISDGKENVSSTFTDSRDGKVYKIASIGKQTWMAENLSYNAKGSLCYGNEPENCTNYGKLYNWETAKKACPKGWHLPSDKEWQALVAYAGGNDIAGKKLKAKNGWEDNGNGTDEFGFAALPGGAGLNDGSFDNDYVGKFGLWWSASEYDGYAAYNRSLHYNYRTEVIKNYDNKDELYSVRCLKD